MTNEEFKKLALTPTNYSLDWKALCLLKRDHDINLLTGTVDAFTDPVALTKIVYAALLKSNPNITEADIEENMSISLAEDILKHLSSAYAKQFKKPANKRG